MELSYKWLIAFLCVTTFHLIIVLKTTHVSAQVEAGQESPCPSTLLQAVLKHDVDVVRLLLEYGVDPNASLENCQVVITNGVIVLLKEDQRFIDAWRPRRSRRTVLLRKLKSSIPDNSSLLHIAARIRPSRGQWLTPDPRIYDLLVQHGAE